MTWFLLLQVFLAICLFFGTLGLIQLDVMADTMVVERSKFEPDENKGKEERRE